MCPYCLFLESFFFSSILPPVVQGCSRPGGDGEEAGGGSIAVHSEGWDTDCGPGPGQTGLGAGVQQGELRLVIPI